MVGYLGFQNQKKKQKQNFMIYLNPVLNLLGVIL